MRSQRMTPTRSLRRAASVLVARSFALISVIWWTALVAGPIWLLVDQGTRGLAPVLGLLYAVVLGAGRRALPMLLRARRTRVRASSSRAAIRSRCGGTSTALPQRRWSRPRAWEPSRTARNGRVPLSIRPRAAPRA
jgi:hypothetical protein